MEIGFTSFDEPVVESKPTTAELVAALTAAQRGAILTGFANKILPKRLRKTIHVPTAVIAYLYSRLDVIEEYSRKLMRGEAVEKVVDELTTYVKAPKSITALKTAVYDKFSDEFTASQVGAIVDRMLKMSKTTADGTFRFYATNVVK